MVGLPYQDYRSVMDTVEYGGELLRRFGENGTLLPMIAPLAPFVDPGCRLFEEAERFGYRLFARTLREHRQAMLMPTWKQRLNYETSWMSRDEIVRATYDGALRLIELKAAHGLLDGEEADEIRAHIRMAVALEWRIENADVIDGSLREDIFRLNRMDLLCQKHELQWPVKGLKLKLPNILKLLFGR
ncbi:hypothetical protein A2G06_04710 [Geobacter anodireducens]|nr:hypothetical protein A2G06_04710 [Geobacter anodireducens]